MLRFPQSAFSNRNSAISTSPIHILQHPQLTGCAGDRQEQAIDRNRKLHPAELCGERLAWAVERRHAEWIAGWRTRNRIEPAAPYIPEPAAIGCEVDGTAVRRPVWFVVVRFAIRDRLPFAARHRHDVHRRTRGVTSIDGHETDPALIR